MTRGNKSLEEVARESYRHQEEYQAHTNALRTVANSVITNGNYSHIKKKRSSHPEKHAIHILARPYQPRQDLESGFIGSLDELKEKKKRERIEVGRYAIMLNLRGTIFNDGMHLFYESPVMVKTNHLFSPLYNDLHPAVHRINEYSEENRELIGHAPEEYFTHILGIIDEHIHHIKKIKPLEFKKPKKGVIPYLHGERGNRVFRGYQEPHHFEDMDVTDIFSNTYDDFHNSTEYKKP